MNMVNIPIEPEPPPSLENTIKTHIGPEPPSPCETFIVHAIKDICPSPFTYFKDPFPALKINNGCMTRSIPRLNI